MKGYCPYCKAVLEPPPKRKKKCPECGQAMYVRNGKLLQEFDALREDWLNYLSPLDVKKRDFDRARDELKNKFGTTPGFYDVVWQILNGMLLHANEGNKIQIYYEMARAAGMEGKDPKPYIAEALTTRLEDMKRGGVQYVEVTNYGGSPDYSTCENCAKLHGQVFSIDVALETLPVPSLCTNSFGCRCEYRPSRRR